MKQELTEVIKLELSQMASQYSPSRDAVSMKGNYVEATAKAFTEEPFAVDVAIMGLYIVGDKCTWLVALGKMYDNHNTIHNVPYADDVVRVSVVTVYDADAPVPFPTSEIHYMRVVVNTFIGWPTHLVKPVSDEVFIFPLHVYSHCHIVKSCFINLV